MPKIQTLYAALQAANAACCAPGSDAEYAESCARQTAAIQALALERCATPWDLHLVIRAAHDVVRDESDDDAHFTDGRLALLMCAIERDAIALAHRFNELETQLANARAAA
jgi:hypothetical protein